MKPSDLDDFAPVEPDGSLLAVVHARSHAIRRRRDTQRAITLASGALVLVFAVGIALTHGEVGNGHVSRPASTTTTAATPLPKINEGMVKGTWRPVSISGYNGPLTDPPLGWKPRLSFDGAGHFGGSDGCNDVAGTYGLGAEGSFHLEQQFSTAVLCLSQTPTPASLQAASRVELLRGQLTFFARDGHELARYARVPVESPHGPRGG